jgi:SAM-dependent methyltransferase
MDNSRSIYQLDLAYIHDAGFRGFIDGCAPELLRFLLQADIPDGLVVDLGCGGGIWAEYLTRTGYQVLGVDISPSCVALARQRVPTAKFRAGSLWECSLPRCRAVTALGEVLSYGAEPAKPQPLDRLFCQIYAALEPGGLFIFDVAEVGLDRHRQFHCAEGDDWACLVRFEYEEAHDRLIRQITTFRWWEGSYRRAAERHVLQLYRGADVARQLREAGFRVRRVRRFGSFPLLPKRVGFIARK